MSRRVGTQLPLRILRSIARIARTGLKELHLGCFARSIMFSSPSAYAASSTALVSTDRTDCM